MDQLFDERFVRFTGAIISAIMIATAIRAIIESQRIRVGSIAQHIHPDRQRRYRIHGSSRILPSLYPFIHTRTNDDEHGIELNNYYTSDELRDIRHERHYEPLVESPQADFHIDSNANFHHNNQPTVVPNTSTSSTSSTDTSATTSALHQESNNIYYISYEENDNKYKLLTIVDTTFTLIHAMLVHRSDLTSIDTLSYNGLACSEHTIDVTRFMKMWLGESMNHLYYYNQNMKWIQLLNRSNSAPTYFFDNYEEYIIVITYKIKDELHIVTNDLHEQIKIAEFI